MSRNSLINDPEIRAKIIEDLALGIPDAQIAEAYGVHRNTVGAWKKKKKIRAELGQKTLEAVRDPLKAVRSDYPLPYIERHPATREVWAPPKVREAPNISLGFTFAIEYVNKAARQLPDEEIIEIEGEEQAKLEHKGVSL